MSGRNASHDELSDAGFTRSGVDKGSVGADIQSKADKSGGDGKDLVSHLQSAGAKGEGFTGSNVSRSTMDNAGFRSGGVDKDSLGAHTMSDVDKSGKGEGLKASLQSIGAKK